uniref:Serpin 4 n=1 Tax=Psoroptes ovis TaxID=83912 RepID=A0A8F2JFG4_PSOOV|nr:serpin 4 [Psoroptes ovis]
MYILLSSLIVLLGTIVNGQTSEQPLELQPLVKSSNDLAINLLEHINLSPPDDANDVVKALFDEPKNVLLSPFGLMSSMVMLYQGANGKTSDEFAHILKLETLDKESLPKLLQEQYEQLRSTQGVKYRMANALVGKHEFTDAYKKLLEDYFQAKSYELSSLDMNDLNKMFADKTDNMIPQMLLQKPGDDTGLLLADGTSFDGNWKFPFYQEDSHVDVFFSNDDKQFNNVTFMRRFGRFGFTYSEDLEADLIEVPFENDLVAFYALLPRDPNDDLSDIRKNLNATYLEQLIARLSYRLDSTIELPLINMDYEETQLIKVLKNFGLNDALDEQTAQFGSMTDKSLKLTGLLYRSKLLLNENEQKRPENDENLSAAAPLFYNLNHPFYYFIRHKQTGQLLMLGELHSF